MLRRHEIISELVRARDEQWIYKAGNSIRRAPIGSAIRNSVSPALTDISKKFGNTELLDAIINPSAAIVVGYEPWLVNTSEGESLYGFLISSNKQSIVLKDISGNKHIIPLKKISSKSKQSQSLMPDPISNGLKEQDLSDVAACIIANGKK